MGYEGTLNSESFANILDILCGLNKDGVLTVFDDKRKKSIYFHNKGVTLIGGTQRMKIGDMLLRTNKIDPRELDRALSEQKTTGRLLGEIIIEQGLVTAEEIDELIADQIEEEICDFFFWENAKFIFQEGPLPNTSEPSYVNLTFDVRKLLFRIADKIGEWEKIRQQLPSFGIILVPSKSTIDIELSEKVEDPQNFERVLIHLNGSNDIFDIIRLSQLTVLSVCKVLLILLEQNAIRRASFEELILIANDLGKKTKTPKQLHILEQALLLRPNDEQLLLQITHAYENLGIGKKTAEFYFKLGDKAFLSDPKTAMKYLERAISHAPNFVEAYEKILLLVEGNVEQELKYSKILINILLQEKLYNKAEQVALKYSERYSEDIELIEKLAKSYTVQNKNNLAIKSYEDLVFLFHKKGIQNLEVLYLNKILEIDSNRVDVLQRVRKIEYSLKWGKYRNFIVLGIFVSILVVIGISFIIYYEMAARNLYSRAKKSEFVNDILAKKLHENLIKNYSWSTMSDDSEKALEAIDIRLKSQVIKPPSEEIDQVRLQQFEYVKNLAKSGKFSEAYSYLVNYRQEYKETKWQKMCDDIEKFIKTREEENLKKEFQNKLKIAKEYQKEGKSEDAIVLYQTLQKCKFNEIAQAANLALNDLQQKKTLQLLTQIKETFEEGNKEEKNGNLKNAMQLYEKIKMLSDECKNLSKEQELEVLHFCQLAHSGISRIDSLNNAALDYLKRAQELEQQGKITEAFQTVLEVLENPKLSKTEIASKAYLPIQIITIPSRATIKEYSGKTPIVIPINPQKLQNIEISFPGFINSNLILSSKSNPIVEVVLQKKILWNYDATGAISGKVAHYQNMLVLTTRAGQIAALSSKDGKVLWEYQIRSSIGDIESGAQIANNNVYVGSNDCNLYCLNIDTGKLDWSFNSKGFITTSPLIEQNNVLFGNSEGNFFCLNASNGKKNWEIQQRASFSVSPVIWGNAVIAGTNRGEIVALNILDGRQLWTQNFEEPIITELILADKSLYFSTIDSFLYCWDVEDKKLNWKIKIQGQICGHPTMSGKFLYLGTTSGTIYCISRNNGQIIWNKKAVDSMRSAISVIEDFLYVGGMDGFLYILDKDGELFWKGSFGSKAIRSDITSTEGNIFIGTEDGILYSLPKK